MPRSNEINSKVLQNSETHPMGRITQEELEVAISSRGKACKLKWRKGPNMTEEILGELVGIYHRTTEAHYLVGDVEIPRSLIKDGSFRVDQQGSVNRNDMKEKSSILEKARKWPPACFDHNVDQLVKREYGLLAIELSFTLAQAIEKDTITAAPPPSRDIAELKEFAIKELRRGSTGIIVSEFGKTEVVDIKFQGDSPEVTLVKPNYEEVPIKISEIKDFVTKV